MRHLSPEQLLDLAEGADAGAESHLQACEACRQQVASLRLTMAAVSDVAVPEPSPLFWEHLSTRVRDATAQEPATSRWHVWTGSLRFWRFAAVAGAAGVLAVALSLREPGGPASS